MMPAYDLAVRAEALIRNHEDRCVGDYRQDEPWCSCAPDGAPLCKGCSKLAASILAELEAVRNETIEAVLEAAEALGEALSVKKIAK